MSNISRLHGRVLARFRDVFGTPERTMGRDHRWSLRPDGGGGNVTLRIDCYGDDLEVWILDPLAQDGGVQRCRLTNEQETSDVILRVRKRIHNESR